jgi:hypothetical protein
MRFHKRLRRFDFIHHNILFSIVPTIPIYYSCYRKKIGSIALISTIELFRIVFLLHTSPFQTVVYNSIVHSERSQAHDLLLGNEPAIIARGHKIPKGKYVLHNLT